MLKKIFKAAKKAAPIIGGTIGFALGGPMGASIGSGLGSLAGGRSVEDSLRNAAIAGAMGYGAKTFMGMPGGKGLGSLKAFGSNFAPTQATSATQIMGRPMQTTMQNPSTLSKLTNFIKANPKKSAIGAALGLGALGGMGGEEEETITMDDITGTKGNLRDLQTAEIIKNQVVPYGQMGNAYGLADGGLAHLANGGYMSSFPNQNMETQSLTASDNIDDRIMQNLQFERMAPGMMGYADGGDFPRKNGPIAGPGTETSDEVPAMLSDGEFVINARTVRGLGAAMGAKNKEDERDRGSNFLYSIQDNYGEKA
jgi:hypothetical protein